MPLGPSQSMLVDLESPDRTQPSTQTKQEKNREITLTPMLKHLAHLTPYDYRDDIVQCAVCRASVGNHPLHKQHILLRRASGKRQVGGMLRAAAAAVLVPSKSCAQDV